MEKIFCQTLQKGFLFALMTIATSPIFASPCNIPPVTYKDCPSPCVYPNSILAIQAGRFWTNQGESQHIGIDGLIGDEFTVDDGTDQNYLLGLGYYYNVFKQEKFNLYLGLNAFYLPQTKVNGDVIQEDIFHNLSYDYTIKNYPVYVAAKGLFPVNCDTFMTIDLGLGANFIKTSDVDEHSKDDGFTIPDDMFSGKTTTVFSASAGLGVQFRNILNTFALEVGYRFFYLGKGRFEKESDQIQDTLDTGNSYANALIVSVIL